MPKFLFQPTHNMSRTDIYHVWRNMKARCDNPNNKEYHRYGGRGIGVCDEWYHSFPAFYDWSVQSGYRKGLTLDRIDNNKGYSPSNCRWATYGQQLRNTSRTRMITYNGKTQCITDWATEIGICARSFKKRLNSGRPLEEVFYKGKLERRSTKRTEDSNA